MASANRICPKCGANVFVSGWTERSKRARTYMQFARLGAVTITESEEVEGAYCTTCEERLPVSASDLKKEAVA